MATFGMANASPFTSYTTTRGVHHDSWELDEVLSKSKLEFCFKVQPSEWYFWYIRDWVNIDFR